MRWWKEPAPVAKWRCLRGRKVPDVKFSAINPSSSQDKMRICDRGSPVSKASYAGRSSAGLAFP
jgi:hypothetical protein